MGSLQPRSASFLIVENTSDYITIRDVGPWCDHPTVTNDAEGVVARLAQDESLGSRRLFYYDSSNDLDELVHDGLGRFLRFSHVADSLCIL